VVTITNGKNTFETTKGAYETIFKSMGYAPLTQGGDSIQSDNSEVDSFISDVEEKPIGNWTKQEIKEYARRKNISLDGARNISDYKARILDYWDSIGRDSLADDEEEEDWDVD